MTTDNPEAIKPRVQWEYTVIERDSTHPTELFHYGENGWECFTVVKCDELYVFYFKRQNK